jgi:hypothetical protein
MMGGLRRWLVAMADPAGQAAPGVSAASEVPEISAAIVKTLPRRAMRPAVLRRIFDLADRHGVLPAVKANVEAVAAREGPGRVVAIRRGGGDDWPAEAVSAMEEARRTLAARTALCLMLRQQWTEIRAALAAAHVPVIVLKGQAFADRLYERPSLRPFTDLDLMVPRAAAVETAGHIERLGYRPGQPLMKYDAGYGELTMRRNAQEGAVELHTNLVNSPLVRKGVSVAMEDLQYEGGGFACDAPVLTPASLLAIAAVHGAASHGFDRLQILCDVAQAARGAAGELDEAWLAALASGGRAGLCLATALDLTARILGEPRCDQLRRRLGLEVPRSVRILLSRGVVLRAHAYLDSFRRQAFREMLKGR